MYKALIIKDESSSEFPTRFDCTAVKSEVKYRQFVETNGRLPDFKPRIIQHIYDDPEFNQIHDFIFSPVERMIVSDKVKNILLDYKLPNHDFIKIKVKSVVRKLLFFPIRKRHDNYFKFFFDCHYIDKLIDYIDFDKTSIEVKDGNGLIVNKTITRSNDIYEMIDSNRRVSEQINLLYKDKSISTKIREEKINELNTGSYYWEIDEIYLKSEIKNNYDMFELPLFSSMTYVSERLVERLENEHISGFKVIDTGVKSRLKEIKNPKLTI
jgi:hypothetical protein